MSDYDRVNHPPHYSHPSGIETIQIFEKLSGCVAACFKYFSRAGKKPESPTAEDYQKAAWFARRAAENKLPIVVDDDAEGVFDLIHEWIQGEPDVDKQLAANLLCEAVVAQETEARTAAFERLDQHLLGCSKQ